MALKNLTICLICILICKTLFLHAQVPDSSNICFKEMGIFDSSNFIVPEKSAPIYLFEVKQVKANNIQTFPENSKQLKSKDFIFYFLCGMLLVLGLFRMVNNKYFTTITRVFFNNSLRQNQFTEQLLQAKAPSLLMNLFFTAMAGMYIFLMLVHWKKASISNSILMVNCMLFVFIVYASKYIILQFIGWMTGFVKETNQYLFLVFLLNKMLGIMLLPIVATLAFSQSSISDFIFQYSLLILAFMYMLRYFRAFSLLRRQLAISRFHLILYIIAMEMLPILMIYKSSMIFLEKTL